MEKAENLADNLRTASVSLSEIFQNESASTGELSATSETLLNNNNLMLDKAEKSKDNLIELENCSEEMSRKMVIVDEISNKLLDESTSSENRLNHLVEISEQAMQEIHTIQSKQKGVIGQTVSINENISGSIVAENDEFNNIASMIDNSAMEISEMAVQVDKLNQMITELDMLLRA